MSTLSPAAAGGRRLAAASHDAWPFALGAAVLAVAGLGALQLAAWANALDGPVELPFIAGVVLLLWSVVACGIAAVVLWRHRRDERAAWVPSAAVLAGSVAVVAAAMWLHPLLGSGGGGA